MGRDFSRPGLHVNITGPAAVSFWRQILPGEWHPCPEVLCAFSVRRAHRYTRPLSGGGSVLGRGGTALLHRDDPRAGKDTAHSRQNFPEKGGRMQPVTVSQDLQRLDRGSQRARQDMPPERTRAFSPSRGRRAWVVSATTRSTRAMTPKPPHSRTSFLLMSSMAAV